MGFLMMAVPFEATSLSYEPTLPHLLPPYSPPMSPIDKCKDYM